MRGRGRAREGEGEEGRGGGGNGRMEGRRGEMRQGMRGTGTYWE